MFTRSITFLVILSALLAACAPQPALVPTDMPTAEATATDAPAAVSTLPVQPTMEVQSIPTTEQPSGNKAWVQYRDPRYGIGVAYPCWWIMYPMPAEGSGGALSLRSFDEDYFRANSIKGQWKGGVPPEGAFTADFLVFEGIDPATSNADAYPRDPMASAIVSSEDVLIGQNKATVIQLKDLVNSNDSLFTAILFRLAPDKLMIFVTQQQDRLDSADFQGILSSLSLSPDQPITVPTVAPHPPLIPAACLSQ
jgi:hypothetical protein